MRKVEKPWGHEIIWAETKDYVGKLLHINAGHRLSLQFHRIKEETVYVLSGILYIYDGDGNITKLTPGQSFHVNPLQVHRNTLEAIGYFASHWIALKATGLLKIGELGDFHAV